MDYKYIVCNCFIFWEKMQVLKKFRLLLWLFVLTGCDPHMLTRSDLIVSGGIENPRYSYNIQDMENNFKTAMLLPLSGKASSYGQGLKNAAMMAIEDADNANLIVQFYDTHSSPSGAQEAARRAISDGNRLILGPLMSEEAAAVSVIARRNDVPVISFSTAPSVLQEGVYTLGLLGNEQIERIITYAAAKNRLRIAVLTPDTTAGLNMAKAAVFSAQKQGARVVRIGFYPADTLDFSAIVKSLTDYDIRSEDAKKKKQELTILAKAGDRAASRELNKLKTVYSSGEVDFDAVLIMDSGNRLKSAASMFGYYDVSYPDVLFMGTSMWENTALAKETTLYHGVYPTLSRVHNDYFNKKYEDLFGQIPNSLYSFAYDGVALASSLSKKDPDDITQNITDSDGFIGINGTFRILENGKNQHSLDIVEITADGLKIVDKAPKKLPFVLERENFFYAEDPTSYPMIFGKDRESVLRYIYNSRE